MKTYIITVQIFNSKTLALIACEIFGPFTTRGEAERQIESWINTVYSGQDLNNRPAMDYQRGEVYCHKYDGMNNSIMKIQTLDTDNPLKLSD